MTNIFQKIRRFYAETYLELQKSSWPTKVELRDSTIVVVFAILLMGVYVSIIDFSLFQVVNLFSKIINPLG